MGCGTTTARSSRRATSSSCRRARRPKPWASRAARSSRACRGPSTGSAQSWRPNREASMSERDGMPLTGLEAELVELGRSLAFPMPSTNFAGVVAERIARRPRRWWFGVRPPSGRPVSRALLIAIALLLVVVAVAAALEFGFPGLRIVFGGPAVPSPTPGASRPSPSGAPGSAMGLGTAVPLAELDAQSGFHVLLPADPALGPPDAAYLMDGRVAVAWGPRAGFGPTLEPGVSLVISEFQGNVGGYFEKMLGSGTQVTRVTVRGAPGYWISGDPHFFFYVDPSGQQVQDTHRAVGDTLVWASEGLTFRIESSAGKDATIAIAESLH